MSVTYGSLQEHLSRAEIWSQELKEALQDSLMAQTYVDWLTGFPDGDQFNIGSVGDLSVDDYQEDTSIRFQDLDTGEFTFTINNYKSAGIYITDKTKQDSWMAERVMSQFVPKMQRALEQDMETKILNLQAGQTASNLNLIFGARHRFVASGTNEVMTLDDFISAKYALDMAKVPNTRRVAIVDPSVEVSLNRLAGDAAFSARPIWDNVINAGFGNQMRFIYSIYGFEVYVSNYLADANETINSVTAAAGKANLFFSADSSVLPFVGAWRQAPKVESQRNIPFQRDEYFLTARYGLKLYRPENLVTIISDTDQVYA
jgi:hypothetical protein